MVWTHVQRSTFGLIFLVSVLGSSSAEAQKVDLSLYLSGIPSVGDARIYSINNGDFLVQEVVEVQLTPKAWRVVLRQQQTGQPETFGESFVVVGRQQLMSDLISVPLSIDLKKPKRIQKFTYTIGKRQRAQLKGEAFTNFSSRIGPALILAESEFLGFENIDTSFGSFPGTARLETSLAIGIVISLTGDTVSSALWQTAWIDPFFGPVLIFRSVSTYLNGFEESDTGMLVFTLEYALIDGVEYF